MKTIETTKYCIFELQKREAKAPSRQERFIVGQELSQTVGNTTVKQKTLQPTARVQRNLTTFKTLFLGLGLMAASLATHVDAQVIRLISSPGQFFVDDKSGNGIVYNYAAYTISNNTASAIPSTYVAITNIASTNQIVLSPIDSGVRALGALPPGQMKMVAFYLMGPGLTKGADSLFDLTNENHTIQVLDGPPGIGSVLASSTYGYSNILFVIEALANKVTIITNLNPFAVVGENVDLVIGGDTGTIGGQNSLSFSPGVFGSWRPDAYELIGCVMRFTENPTYTNRLFFDPSIAGFTNFTGQSYTNTFTFRAIAVTGTNVEVSPFAFIDSGANVKHTTLTSLGGGGSNVIVSATNALIISSHTVTPSSIVVPGGTVTYTITFSNSSPSSVNMDEIRDTLPGFPDNMTFVPGSATYNSLSLGNPNISGQLLRWPTPFPVEATNSSVLTFQAIAPATVGQYTNSVIALIGATVIDTTLVTTDNVPSLSVLAVVSAADLAVGKTGPASVFATENFDYTISVTNLGPSTAMGLSVTDSLPAGVTFVSASAGGVFSGGNVIWSNLGDLAINDFTNLTITVTAPANGTSLTNTATAASSNVDTNPANTISPPVTTTVIPVAEVSITKSGPAGAVQPGANFDYTITVANGGPSIASSVTVTDSLPANVTFVSATGGGVFAAGDVTWALGDLASGAGTNLTLTVTAPLRGAVTNVASVGGPTTDPNPTNNTTPPVTTTISNLPPVAVDDSSSTPTNTPVTISVLDNDSDPNGDPLTIISAIATNGTAIISGTNVIFTPDPGFGGYTTIIYTITDGSGGTNSALITVLVGNLNNAPIATDDFTNTLEDVQVTIQALANDSDPDGDTLTITSVSATNGNAVISGTNVVFTPDPEFSGTATIGYTIIDGNGASNSALITITVTAVNDDPIANDDSTNTLEDVSVTINPLVNDTDIDGGPLSVTSVSATNGTAIIVDGTNVVFTPDADFNGTATIGYTISDGNGGSASALITVTVTPVNDAPIAVDDSTNTLEDASVTISPLVNDTDVDGDTLTIVSVSATNGSVVISGTNVLFTPDADFNGTATIGYTITDGNGGTNSAVITVTVTPVNDAPIANDDTTNTLEDVSVTITPVVNDTDIDGDVLTITSVSATNGSAIIVDGTNVVFTPNADFNGTATIGYTISDGNGGSASALITVTVTPVNDVPIANDDSTNTLEDVSVTITPLVNDTDVDGDTLTVVSVSATNGSAIIVDGTNVVFTPSADFNGTATIGYTISDGNGGSASALITVTVTPVNDSPIANDDSTNTLEDVSVTISPLVNDTDVDGDTLSITSVSATNGSAVISGTNVVFTPTANFNGTATIGYAISDGNGGTASALITVTVIAVNDPPVASDDSTNTLEDVSVTIPVLVNDSDVDGDTLTITSALAVNGSAVISGTNIIFTPTANFNGTAAIAYIISDGNGGTASATATVTVISVNDAPVAVNDTTNTLEDVSVTISPLVNDSDVDGDTLSITSVSATNGSAVISGTNVVFTPTADFNGTATIGYTISDGNGGTASALITVTVTPVNDAPIANDDSTNTLEDVSVTISPLVNDSDVDGDTLSITSVSATNGSAVISGTNIFFTPTLNFNGTATIGYTISDGNGGTASAVITVTVAAVNDSPVALDDSASTLQNTPVTVSAVANDSDVDGDTLTITATAATNGTASVVNGTNILFTPTPGFVGTATVGYTISDGNGGTASALVTVTVGNQAPIAVDDTATTPENTPVVISPLVNDSDPDGDTLTITGTSATNGTVSVINGTNLLFTPTANFVGTATVGYTISDGNGGTASAVVSVSVVPSADVSVSKSGISMILAGSAITYTISVTNNGPSTATNVVVTDNLPSSLTFSNASSGGVFSSGVVTWPGINLANGEFTNYTLVAIATAGGAFTNTVSGTSTTPDPVPTNNNGTSASGQVTTTAVTPTFGVSAGAIVLNPQTGLYEQIVFVTNTTIVAVPGVRLNVTVSRSGVSLYNATGTNGGTPYVQYNLPLGTGEAVRFRLEFYNPSRLPFTDTLTAEAATGATATATVAGDERDIDRAFMDNRLSPTEIRFVIEFISTPGLTYTFAYSDEFPVKVWKVAVPSITANANRTQWYDDGPPKTDSRPSLKGMRMYQVIKQNNN